MYKNIYGTPDEINKLVDALEIAVKKGIESISINDVRTLKGYGIFVEYVNGEITFGIRIRTLGGRVNPKQLRVIGELSKKYGRNYVDVTNRMGFQIHYLNVNSLRKVIYNILSVGLTSKGGCGDTPRAITTCPVADVDPNQLFNVLPVIEMVNEYYYKKWDVFGPDAIPRKFKVAITACPSLCSFPEINCVGLIGVIKDGVEGFTVTIGGGLSNTPHIGKHMPIFLYKENVPKFLEAIVEIWKNDP